MYVIPESFIWFSKEIEIFSFMSSLTFSQHLLNQTSFFIQIDKIIYSRKFFSLKKCYGLVKYNILHSLHESWTKINRSHFFVL